MSMNSFHARAPRPRRPSSERAADKPPGWRVDAALVAVGLAPSRTVARRLIEDGRVTLAGLAVTKATQWVADPSRLAVRPTASAEYVSRGGYKLAGALLQTGLAVAGKTCLDIGQSTGGFTDCLLQQGARHVVGIDVGHGQLHARIAQDARVEHYEGVNARFLEPSQLGGRRFDLVVADLSFISLTLIIPRLPPLLAPQGDALLLVKPQFEVGAQGLGKGGIVRNASLYTAVEEKIAAVASAHGLVVCAWFESPLTGAEGNREFFVHLRHA
ncbi:MAG: TlyA family RNA methyltransferase [Rhodocyclaceae bacterium]|nr:TlyA family RNA methyltransferase [Rhodocyclaceae bacterium]